MTAETALTAERERERENYHLTFCTGNAQCCVKEQRAHRCMDMLYLLAVIIGWYCHIVKAQYPWGLQLVP